MAAVSKVVYGENTLIDLTGDTVTPDVLMEGYTAHDAAGNTIIGTASGGGSINGTVKEYTVKNGKSVAAGDFVELSVYGLSVPAFSDTMNIAASVSGYPSYNTASIAALSDTDAIIVYRSGYNYYCTNIYKDGDAWVRGASTQIIAGSSTNSYYAVTQCVTMYDNLAVCSIYQPANGGGAGYYVTLRLNADKTVTVATQSVAYGEFCGGEAYLTKAANDHVAMLYPTENSTSDEALGLILNIAHIASDGTITTSYVTVISDDGSYNPGHWHLCQISDNRLAITYNRNKTQYVDVYALSGGTASLLAQNTFSSNATTYDYTTMRMGNDVFALIDKAVIYKYVYSNGTLTKSTINSAPGLGYTMYSENVTILPQDATHSILIGRFYNSNTWVTEIAYTTATWNESFSSLTLSSPTAVLPYLTYYGFGASQSDNKIFTVYRSVKDGQFTVAITDRLATTYAAPVALRIDGVAKTGGTSGEVIEVYVPE